MSIIEQILKFFTIPLLSTSFLLLFFILFISRILFEKQQRKKNAVGDKIDTFLITHVFGFDDSDPLFIEHAKTLTSEIPFNEKWCKEFFITKLINLKHDVKSASFQILKLYEALDLYKHSIELIRNRRWYQKGIGFYHFQALGFTSGIKYIKPYMHHKNEKLRSNAYTALLYLTEEPMDFLSEYHRPILKASEHKVINILYEKKPTLPLPGNIDQWLEVKNESIVRLGIKIMVFHNYIGASEKLIALLASPNRSIRREAIEAIEELYLFEAENDVLELFKTSTSKREQKLILNTLSVIGSKLTINFIADLLKDPLITSDIKLQAVKCIKELDASYLNTHSELRTSEIVKMELHTQNFLVV
ncbi:HEAT repeat domain-containing protein [Galbibacter sp. EGI 63066]|uniref:HEAT repeat domain-containing protein n=1 Tax=Galbibacter sp. EGI 63066 TaxID=2993559 RepID=UPI002249596A|nr:HEAT repeat domain-containing protein [Galbibacter sp. EGI 63066]MCX2678410.1 HEAT repeat domain-containing protein [Galbibacter sp. EGI 63066]